RRRDRGVRLHHRRTRGVRRRDRTVDTRGRRRSDEASARRPGWMGYRIGIDTGGTFTDLILVDPDGRVDLFKVPSTPDAPPRAIENGLTMIAERLGSSVPDLLARCDLIIHGTTVALNALIQLQGAKVGLFCTRGHEDSL